MDQEIPILYSNGCPRCNVLKMKLTSKGIAYVENNSVDDMLALDIETAPVLYANGKYMMFAEANDWINTQ